jgi:glycosyltransferase involved in cell wall biosynthesis
MLPSAQRNRPLSIMEASAAGLPVLATRVGGVADLVDEGRTGFLCDVDDVRQLADRMRTLIVHPALRQQMGQEGKAVAATRWRPETAGRRLLDVYRQVAASG